MKKQKLSAALLAAAAGMMFVTIGHAQSVDALLDKLVDKGVLTVKEANDLKHESDKNFTTAYQAKTGMSDWVTALKFNGDVRARYEGFFYDAQVQDRNRFRYRVRFGATAVIKDDFEAGLRLTSGEPAGGNASFGGDPVSGNTTFSGNGSKKFVYLDLAYAKWTPLHSSSHAASMTVGKMENPFVFPSTILFDRDYTPEGLAAEYYEFGVVPDKHTVKLIGGAFALNEISGSGKDPFLGGVQARWDAKWTPKLATSAGVGLFAVGNTGNLKTGDVPDQDNGNRRVRGFTAGISDTTKDTLLSNFNPIYADLSATYTLASGPLYSGAFPVTLSGDFLHNPAAKDRNTGYTAGLTFGKSGKKGLWEISYRWANLEADAWYEEFEESDFGAYYSGTAPAGAGAIYSGRTSGYGYGTNVRGHIIRLGYSPYDSLTLNFTYWLTELIDKYPGAQKSGTGRLQADLVWKF